MRKKGILKQMAHDHPDRIFTRDRDPEEFSEWLEEQRHGRKLTLELGIGMGDFLCKRAKEYPDRFFLGVEIKDERIYKAFRNADQEGLQNIAFLQIAIESIARYQLPSPETMYLLFPDPWPKKRHIRRRLMAPSFLKIYADFLSNGGKLIFRTDNHALFDYALESLAHERWKLSSVNRDNSTAVQGQTAYEKKFRAQQIPIASLEASPIS